jgi:hypothetical protein
MGSHPFPEIPCKICAKAIDLNVDLLGDENGKAVHGSVTSDGLRSVASVLPSLHFCG